LRYTGHLNGVEGYGKKGSPQAAGKAAGRMLRKLFGNFWK